MYTRETIISRFWEVDGHDDTFMGLRVTPPQSRDGGPESVVEVDLLQQHSENLRRTLRFTGCANLRVAMDFDVIAENYKFNTSRVDAHADPARIRDLMVAQNKDSHVSYLKESHNPLNKKLERLNEFVLFRVKLFGGVIEVIARDFEVKIIGQSE